MNKSIDNKDTEVETDSKKESPDEQEFQPGPKSSREWDRSRGKETISDNVSDTDADSSDPSSIFSFHDCTLTSEEIQKMDIPEKKTLVEDWLKEGDLGFIYAPPGVGKSWLSMHLAACIANARKFGHFEVPEKSTVLYIDGEMGLDTIKERGAYLNDENIKYLNFEIVQQKKETFLNLADKTQQLALLEYCKDNKINVLFLDNLSCLLKGVSENDADDWDKMLIWLLQLRAHGITTIAVHHTTKSGTTMRGSSRREDAAMWCLRLSKSLDDEESEGALFRTNFTKHRHSKKGSPPALKWRFRTLDDQMTIDCTEANTRDLILELFESCDEWQTGEIADALASSKSGITRMLGRMVKDGILVKLSHGKYRKRG